MIRIALALCLLVAASPSPLCVAFCEAPSVASAHCEHASPLATRLAKRPCGHCGELAPLGVERIRVAPARGVSPGSEASIRVGLGADPLPTPPSALPWAATRDRLLHPYSQENPPLRT